MDSNALLHYDEALGNLSGGYPYGISQWKELQAAVDRDAYSTQLNF
jgi:hypothetical protein